MIIKGHSRKDGAQLARYLLAETAQQKTFVLDQRGSVTDDLNLMFRYWEAEARAMTKGEKPLYHVQIRLAPGETLQKSHWFKTLYVLEQQLKLMNHARAVIAHNLNGEAHLHVVYSRLDPERGKLLNMGNDHKAHHSVARAMEREFGLRQVDNAPKRDRNGNQKTRSIEHRMAKESGTTRKILCNLFKAAWNASKTGRAFQENLARFGMVMTYGDRRDYNVWHDGKRYDPVRLLEAVKTAEFRAKMQADPPVIGQEQRDIVSAQSLSRRKARYITRGQDQHTANLGTVEIPHEKTPDAMDAINRRRARKRDRTLELEL